MNKSVEMADVASAALGRRRVLGGALALAGAGFAGSVLSSCAAGAPSSAGGVGSGKTIGVSLNGLVEYTRYVAEGVAKSLEGTGYKLKIVQANFDIQTELRNLEGLIAQGVAGLVVLPNTVDAVLNAARQAESADIATGIALWAAPGPLDKLVDGVSFVDSVGGGKLIGDWLTTNGKAGKVIVVQGVVGQGFSERIDEGLDSALKGSGFEVAVREQGYFDRNKAIGVVERALQAHPDATTIVSYAAAMGDGISSYLKQNNITNITHVTSDADSEMFDWLGTPYLAATRYYSAAETGLLAANAVRAKLEGSTPTFQNKVNQTMLTSENADEVTKSNPMSYPEFKSKLAGL
jgi:ABC-type sugar transport system substrate-binding protein